MFVLETTSDNIQSFKQLKLSPPLLAAVKQAGYTAPSPIQQKAIPPVLAGRDLLGCAQTGTGKTAAFALPILQNLAAQKQEGKRPIRALVLTPTRELALQIQESFVLYGKNLPLKSTVIFGGVSQVPQVAQLRRGVDILVATPGRLNDLIGQGEIDLSKLEVFVLDEADRMLDMGFVNDVKKVIRQIPQKRQTLLFSATMPDEIISLANSLLTNPARVFVTPVSSTVESIDQSLYRVSKADKRKLLSHLIKQHKVHSALVFTRTKHGADRVARILNRDGITAAAIHGNKSQGARQDALAKFKDGRVQVLVATDIAARGIDIHELSHVFNFDLPNIPETYVHRIGRTGRAGHGGIAISFCCEDEEEYLRDIQKLIGFAIHQEKNHPWAGAPPAGEIAEKAMDKNTDKNMQKNAGQNAGQKNRNKSQKNTQKNTQEKNGQPQKGQKGQGQKGQAPQQKQGQNPGTKQGGRQNQNAKQAPGKNGKNRRRGPMPPYDPYENLTGGNAIVTKPPVWSTGGQQETSAPAPSPAQPAKGDENMSRNRRRGGKNRKKNTENTPQKNQKRPEIPKNENGVFDFSEEELSEDKALKVISRRESDEVKYASFEDFLKDR